MRRGRGGAEAAAWAAWAALLWTSAARAAGYNHAEIFLQSFQSNGSDLKYLYPFSLSQFLARPTAVPQLPHIPCNGTEQSGTSTGMFYYGEDKICVDIRNTDLSMYRIQAAVVSIPPMLASAVDMHYTLLHNHTGDNSTAQRFVSGLPIVGLQSLASVLDEEMHVLLEKNYTVQGNSW